MSAFKRVLCLLVALTILLSAAGCTIRKNSNKSTAPAATQPTEAPLIPVTDLPEFSKNFAAILGQTRTDAKAVNTFMGTLLAAYNTYEPEAYCKFIDGYYQENRDFLNAIKEDSAAAADKAQLDRTPEGAVLATSLRMGNMDMLNALAAFASWRVSYTGCLAGKEPDKTYASLKEESKAAINRFARAFYGQDLLN